MIICEKIELDLYSLIVKSMKTNWSKYLGTDHDFVEVYTYYLGVHNVVQVDTYYLSVHNVVQVDTYY